ncbi:MAG TPA: hypothetical protein VLJ80_04650 [Solirubrobacteraceae bacterium]|nr:hypothetical protein [Solirubrobacteraceae bacterium]
MRIFGIGLLVALVASAIGAGSALASKNPYNQNTWAQYINCPYQNPEINDCIYGRTSGGPGGGEFKYGHMSVKLNKPIVVQVGFAGAGETIMVSPPTKGEALEAPELTVAKGLAVLTPRIQNEAEWPQALKESFAEAKKNKETKATVKIEMAGTSCYETPGCLSVENLLNEKGDAFKLPLKVRVISSWLEKLGGGPCLIGSDENPIKQNLTSSGPGRVGEVVFNETFTNIDLANGQLVDLGWHISKEQGAKGCGGEYEAYIDHAINMALEVEDANGFEYTGKTGITVLTGDLLDGGAQQGVVTEGKESGEIP